MTQPDLRKNLVDFSNAVSDQMRSVRGLLNGNYSNLSQLNTIEKTSLVAAINEILQLAKQSPTLENVDVAVQDYFVLHPQTFTYDRSEAAASWLITHPLDHYPAVQITDSSGTVWRGEVSYPARNQVLVRFNLALAGKAVLT